MVKCSHTVHSWGGTRRSLCMSTAIPLCVHSHQHLRCQQLASWPSSHTRECCTASAWTVKSHGRMTTSPPFQTVNICVCVSMRNTPGMKKCYGKAEKPSPRCKVKMQAACNLGMALLVSLLIKSKTIIVIDTFNPLGRGVLLPVVLVQPEQSLCNRGEPY